jgi:dipeptidyl aminopeptidase/acylaminoacyl peptidase
MKRISFVVFSLAISFSTVAVEKTPFSVRELASLDRISSPMLSPNGQFAVFAVRKADAANSKSNTSLWIENLRARDAAPPVLFTDVNMSVNSPSFSADGQTIYFLSAKSGSMQLWSQAIDSKTASQLSNYEMDIGSYKIAPNGQSVALSFEVFNDCTDLTCSKKRLDEKSASKTSGMLFDKTFIRHWDTYADGRRNQLFVAPLTKVKTGAPVKVSIGIDGDIPSKPFGDASEYTWSSDSQSLVFSVRIAGKTEPWSTNFDLYQVSATGQTKPKNLTVTNKAWDTQPVFSSDGKTLFYRAMKRPGFEADRFALMSMDLSTLKSKEIAPNWDRSASALVLSEDGKTIYTAADDVGQHVVFAIDITSGEAKRIVSDGSVTVFDVVGEQILFARANLASPEQLFLSSNTGQQQRLISNNNQKIIADTAWGEYEQFNFKGWNNETVYGYVVKPANYQVGKQYPIAFLIHGGPQGSFGNGWSYRWNPQTYAGQGFAVVMIDFHGSTGYGQAFTDAISQHWGDRPLEDLQKGYAAALQKYSFLDANRACALGASYGGYMVNWIAGNWPKPWKCLVNHDGVFDTRMMGYTTEELWFTEWENGGTVFDVPQNYEQFNPLNHVNKWRVPMLVVQGELDYRIPTTQGIATFTALQRRGIESQLLIFPNENHWVLKAQNSIMWHDTVNAWLKRWTAETK